jgi:hypothetical protein
LWILDNCDNAGVIDIDLDLASFQIGYQYPMDTLSIFGERIEKLPCGKLFVAKFISFQFGELSRDCKAHNPIFASLEKHNLKGYGKGMYTLLHRVQEKEKDQEKEKEKESNRFRRPGLDEVKLTCAKCGLPDSDAEWFWNKCEGNGWTNGGKPIRSYSHTIAAWKAAGYMPSQKHPQNAGLFKPPQRGHIPDAS